MKTIILTFLVLVVISACTVRIPKEEENKPSTPYNYERSDTIHDYWGSIEYQINEKTIDSCEYIIIFGIDGRDIIHKANCDNPFHNR